MNAERSIMTRHGDLQPFVFLYPLRRLIVSSGRSSLCSLVSYWECGSLRGSKLRAFTSTVLSSSAALASGFKLSRSASCRFCLLSRCPTVLLSHCLAVPLSHCLTVLLSCCPTVWLSHCLLSRWKTTGSMSRLRSGVTVVVFTGVSCEDEAVVSVDRTR